MAGVFQHDASFLAHYRQIDHTEQDLWTHLTQTASLSSHIAGKIGLSLHGELLGLMHDIGKATVEFDQYIRRNIGLVDPDEDDVGGPNGKKLDHSTAGAQLLYEKVPQVSPADRMVAEILALVVASHHSGLINCLTPDGDNRFAERMKKDLQETRKEQAWNNLTSSLKKRVTTLLESDLRTPLQRLMQAVIEPSDSDAEIQFKLGLVIKFLFSALIDADRLNTADFENPQFTTLRSYGKYLDWTVMIESLEKKLAQFPNSTPINKLRRQVSDSCKMMSSKESGFFRLTVPTGGGKTLASLRFALHHARQHGMDRIIYVIPYTSIIDQNAQVIREALGYESDSDESLRVVLEHHSNLTPEIEESPRQRLLAENWDAPIVLTTMVQFLETIFGSGTRSCRRMHQLANAVVVFDEVQTLPLRCVHVFNLALRFLVRGCGATAVLCTATQPLLDQVEPAGRSLPISTNNEMTPDVKGLYRALRRVTVTDCTKRDGWSSAEVADLACREQAGYGSVLIIVNTKKAAAELFLELKQRHVPHLYHLSTNMCAAHRMKVLKKVRHHLSKGLPIICVSTQLIEAGVDVDFSVVIRSLAGLDSIAQAAGRCNRNDERSLGRVLIINPLSENIDRLQDIRIGRDITDRILNEFSVDPSQFEDDLLSPTAMERYFYYYFHRRKDEMDYPLDRNSIIGRRGSIIDLLSLNDQAVQAYTRKNQGAPPNLVIRQAFMSAARAFSVIDNGGQGVLVRYGAKGEEIIDRLCGDIDLHETYELLRQAQRYSVNLHRHELQRHDRGTILETRKGSGIFYLDERHYCEDLGFTKNTTELMQSAIV